ncbi:MAG: hypothetical protein VW397_06810 [Candidatus Margulisiibacteriota bacterium]
MNLNFSNSLQLKQSLKLNQVMIQRFNVLQQSVQEFEESIQDQAKQNPFIRVRTLYDSQQKAYVSDDEYVSPVDFSTYNESLIASLTRQLDAQFLSELDYDIILILIDHLDDKGFLSNYKELRSKLSQQFNVDDRYVFKCLKVLQSFEPDGIAARNINECLWNQIESYGLDDSSDEQNLKTLVKDYLDDISNKNFDIILEDLGIDQSQLDHYIDFISHLNPNPASQFSSSETVTIQPSLKIDVQDGVIQLTNLEEKRMSVHLNDEMIQQLDHHVDSTTKKKLNEAKVWIEHFEKRQDLLRRCGEYIVQKQRLFFIEGESYILPCLQKDMALSLGVSESTISRIVRTKYIECDYGILLIKNLCQRSIYGKTKNQVKLLIEYYCERYPQLSDQKLAQLLKSIGLPIARRTVTKYRHETSVSSSYQRKKLHSKNKPQDS